MTSAENQDTDDGRWIWFLVVEGLILLLSLFRVVVVAIVLAVNVVSLRRCMSPKTSKCHCLHLYVSDSVKICNIIYIASWTPFLLYSLLNGRWLLIEEQLFCLIQNYMTNAILMVLLAMAALLAYSRFDTTTSSMTAAFLTLTAWMLPQLSYFIILTTLEDTNSLTTVNFNFLDNVRQSTESFGITYKIGFTICGQIMCRMVMTQYLLQYVVVVLPLCLVLALIFLRRFFYVSRRTYTQLTDQNITRMKDCCSCWHSKGSSELAVILGTIVLWMALIRPLILFFWSPDHLFVDLGSHLVLTVSAVFAPIVPRSPTPHILLTDADVFRINVVQRDPNNPHNKDDDNKI